MGSPRGWDILLERFGVPPRGVWTDLCFDPRGSGRCNRPGYKMWSPNHSRDTKNNPDHKIQKQNQKHKQTRIYTGPSHRATPLELVIFRHAEVAYGRDSGMGGGGGGRRRGPGYRGGPHPRTPPEHRGRTLGGTPRDTPGDTAGGTPEDTPWILRRLVGPGRVSVGSARISFVLWSKNAHSRNCGGRTLRLVPTVLNLPGQRPNAVLRFPSI